MKSSFTRSFPISRILIAWLVLGVFFTHSVLVASAHQRQMHASTDVGKLLVGASQNCQSDRADFGSGSKSHIHQSDCCQFCQSALDDQSYLDVLGLAEIVAILMPPAKESVFVSRFERAVAVSELNGLRSTWSAQAPPKA